MNPSGIVTFLFTDIEGSTMLSQQFTKSYHGNVEKHNLILKEAVESYNGFIFESVGEAFCCAFKKADEAVRAAVEAQIRLKEESWKDADIKVRMGIHLGKAEWNGTKYTGYVTLARTHRVMSTGHGRQIIISKDVYSMIAHSVPLLKRKNGEKISFIDLGEKHLKDLIQPINLYQVTSGGLEKDFPALNTLDSHPNNLPVQLTGFIGRSMNLSEIKKQIPYIKLLTLIGSGGTGKTRLALQIGAEFVNEFENGVWLIELASVRDEEMMLQTIVRKIGIKDDPDNNQENLLIDHLKDKEVLIILDNCEHLIRSCANLSEKLLQNSPKLKIIATSREALKCSGEKIHNVLPFEIPGPDIKPTPERLIQFDAVRLFVERAILVNQNFQITNENAPALSQICYHLDGIPYAIELAAARVKVLTLEQINERLTDRFRLLTGGKRTALPRQQTLKAMIDWSYDLLSEQEKILWRRLSVFAGGFTLDAAEKVCGDDQISEDDILDLLGNLVEKSIVTNDEENVRFRILESTRKYGLEKLKQEDDMYKIQAKYFKYYIELSESSESKLTGPSQREWFDKLESENLNLNEILDWSLKSKNPEEGLRMAVALGRYWQVKGYFSDGRKWYDSFLEAVKEAPKDLLAKVYLNASRLSSMVKDNKKLDSLNEKALGLYRELGDKRGIAFSLNGIGVVEFSKGEYEKARDIFQECLDLAKEIKDDYSTAFFLGNLAEAVLSLNDLEQTGILLNECIAIYRKQGNKRGVAYTLMGLGFLSFKKNDLTKAGSYFEDSIKLSHEINDKLRVTEALNFLIETEIKKGNNLRARELCEECYLLSRELKNENGVKEVYLRIAEIDLSDGLYESAEKLIASIEEYFKSKKTIQFELEPEKFERIVKELKKFDS